jgi:hypothetical protein
MSTPGPSISHYDKPHSQGKQRAFDQGKPPRHWKKSPFCCNHPKRILLFKHPDHKVDFCFMLTHFVVMNFGSSALWSFMIADDENDLS